MRFSVESNLPEIQRIPCIVSAFFESRYLSVTTERLDKISDGYISRRLHYRELEGKYEQMLLLDNIPNISPKYVLLIGCGKESMLNERRYKKIIQKVTNVLNNIGLMEAAYYLIELHIKDRNTYWKVRQAVETIQEILYRFNQLKTNNEKNIYRSLQEITFNIPDQRELLNGKNAIQHSLAISDGIKVAKDLGNMPPNICNSAYLASQAHQLANTFDNITTYVVGEQEMRDLGMHSYLSVGSGSKNESLMSVIKYSGASSDDILPIILIGKGVTFDSGGISSKPSEGMDEMKYDMCGAAAVYGTLKTAALLQLPLNIIGVIASCENMPDGHSYRPGDVLTTMSQQTVEVISTDAEGRLVLCDVFTYVERFHPEVVIDIATLTGSCVIALGHHMSGLISNNDSLAKELICASEQSCDYVWQLPLSDEFQEQIESNIADIANVGGRSGGAITAGCFLSRFAKKYNWAHLDIAGTAWVSDRKNGGATGRPVAMLSQFLLNRAKF